MSRRQDASFFLKGLCYEPERVLLRRNASEFLLGHPRLKTYWLLGFIALVLLMISVGGVTRLTRSGLSIVEWKPVVGIIPPLTEADWQSQFELYQQSPEFQQMNSHFKLEDYKQIFIWEYLHRVLGRLIFLYVLIPGLILWRRKVIKGNLVVLLSLLVAGQGLVGWLMVRSGLNLKPHVSPFMLALHFFLALFVLATAYYHLCKMRPAFSAEMSPKKWFLVNGLGILLLIQIFFGCLTSGMKAGHIFNTYPLMGGEFLPPGGMNLDPAWINVFDNPVTVQWIHRWVGILTLIFLLVTVGALTKWKRSPLFGPSMHLLGLVLVQISLGILNLIWMVPIPLAALHQFIVVLIVLGYLNIRFRLKEVV